MVIPIAAATVAMPTPIGKKAAIIEPNTKARMINVRGPETISALTKSFEILSSNVHSTAIFPVFQETNSPSKVTDC